MKNEINYGQVQAAPVPTKADIYEYREAAKDARVGTIAIPTYLTLMTIAIEAIIAAHFVIPTLVAGTLLTVVSYLIVDNVIRQRDPQKSRRV